MNQKIEGLINNNIESKISMYADDTSFLISPKPHCLQNLIDLLQRFSPHSGLKLNYDKCIILRIGSLKNTWLRMEYKVPVEWTDGPINILGVVIPEHLEQLGSVNWERWIKGKPLTLYGEVALINSLIIPQFLYLFMSLPAPSQPF